MTDIALAHEPAVRAGLFIAILAAMAVWEWIAPRRPRSLPRRGRWPGNLGIVVLDTAAARLLFPTTAVALALAGERHGWGLLNRVGWPNWAAVAVAVAILDLAIYLQHVLFHAVPALWRLHRVHHSDVDFDVTTGTRFHPVEIALSLGIKFMVVAALGAPALAVLIFEALLNATSLFNHGNVRIPARADRLLRRLLVTPDMHRVHHSAVPQETNSNFGFNLAWWDRLFGTYRAQPQAGHAAMTIGIPEFRERKDARLDRLLLQPFLAGAREVPLPARQAGPGGRSEAGDTRR
ncbi:MAG: sterol desaturase family protein [SAR324 cluster bacterium]